MNVNNFQGVDALRTVVACRRLIAHFFQPTVAMRFFLSPSNDRTILLH